MKQLYLLFFVFITTNHCLAQQADLFNFKPKKRFLITSANLGLGLDWAEYEEISYKDIHDSAKNPEVLKRELQYLEEEISTITGSIGLFASVSFAPLNLKTNTYRTDREIRLGATLYAPREAMVSYKNELMDTAIVYCNLQGEFAIDGAYLFKGKLGKKWMWSVGGGLNVGLSHENEVMVIEGAYFEPGAHPSTQESLEANRHFYEAKNAYYLRAYIPYSMHFSVSDRIAIGFECRKGIGGQFTRGQEPNFFPRIGSFILGARYQI